VLIPKIDEVICFDRLLQVLISKNLFALKLLKIAFYSQVSRIKGFGARQNIKSKNASNLLARQNRRRVFT
jgi:hypothetical protein